MNERDKELAKQAGWPESLVSPVIMAKLKEFAALIRADTMEAATRAANESWTLMCKKMVGLEREKVVAEFTEAEQEPEQTAIEQEHKDLRTPKERRAEGQWHCPECFTFGSTHRKECAAATKARGQT